jgi:hypothetical protein
MAQFQSLMPPFTPDDCDVRHVQPYEANKEYLCPFCSQTIEVGVGHEVAVPRDFVDDRRHFHNGCWSKYIRSYKRTKNTN